MSAHRLLAAILLFTVLSRGALAVRPGPCDALARLANPLATEESALREATAEGLRPQEAKRIGQGVYRVPHANGQAYAVRLGNWKQDIAFEAFAHEFLRGVPDLDVIRTVKLSDAAAEAYLTSLKTSPAFVADDLSVKKPDGSHPISIALFLPGPAMTRAAYMSESGISCEARETLIRMMDSEIDLGEDGREQLASDLVHSLKRDSAPARQAFLEDLRAAYPAFKGATTANLNEKLMAFILKARFKRPQKLIELGLRRYPENVRRQLADHWLARAVLGDYDFNTDNWMIYEDRVISIDFAFSSPRFHSGSAFLSTDSPFGFAMEKQMISWASPQVKEFLRSLSSRKIRDIAARSGTQLSEVEIRGILARSGRIPAE